MDTDLSSSKIMLADFYFESLSAALDGLRRSQMLTDVVLVTKDGEPIPAHRVVLVIGCPYFRRILTETSSNQNSIIIHSSINSSSMNAAVEFLYSGQTALPSNIADTRHLLQASITLEMEAFFSYLCNMLANAITTENFRIVWDLADEFDTDKLRDIVTSYVSRDLQCFSSQKQFLLLDVGRMRQLLRSPSVEISSAKSALMAVIKWTSSDLAERIPQMEEELLSRIKFALIPKNDLEYILSSELCVQMSKKLWNLIAETLYSRGKHVTGYQPDLENAETRKQEPEDQEPTNQKTNSSSGEKQSETSNRVVIVDVQQLKVHDASRGSTLTQLTSGTAFPFKQTPGKVMRARTPRRRVWSTPLRLAVEDGLEIPVSTRQETSIMIVGRKKSGEAAAHCFSLQTCIWTSSLNLDEVIANNAAWAIHGNMLYLAGGMDNKDNVLRSMIVYNVQQNSFHMAGRMNIARSSSTAAVISWHIYVVGGLGHHHKPLSHVERYDILIDRWEVVESLPYTGWDVGVAACEGKLWAMGGWAHANTDLSDNTWSLACHYYDPEVNQWTNIGYLPDDFCSTVPVISSHNKKIYAISYYAPNTVWAFDLSTRKWQRLYVAVGNCTSVLRRTLAILPYDTRLWVFDYCGKMLVFNLQSNSWDREYPFSRTITFPLYCSIVNVTIKE